jgi:hypothetical protein
MRHSAFVIHVAPTIKRTHVFGDRHPGCKTLTATLRNQLSPRARRTLSPLWAGSGSRPIKARATQIWIFCGPGGVAVTTMAVVLRLGGGAEVLAAQGLGVADPDTWLSSDIGWS